MWPRFYWLLEISAPAIYFNQNSIQFQFNLFTNKTRTSSNIKHTNIILYFVVHSTLVSISANTMYLSLVQSIFKPNWLLVSSILSSSCWRYEWYGSYESWYRLQNIAYVRYLYSWKLNSQLMTYRRKGPRVMAPKRPTIFFCKNIFGQTGQLLRSCKCKEAVSFRPLSTSSAPGSPQRLCPIPPL